MRKVALVLILSLFLTLLPQTGNTQYSPRIFLSGPLGSTDYPWTMFHYSSLRTGASPATAPSTASLMWTYTTGAQVYGSPAVSDGIVFISSWDGNLYAINEYSGQLKWSFSTGTAIYASPAVMNGIVYVASRNGLLYALNEQTGGLIWRTGNPNFPITSSPPRRKWEGLLWKLVSGQPLRLSRQLSGLGR